MSPIPPPLFLLELEVLDPCFRAASIRILPEYETRQRAASMRDARFIRDHPCANEMGGEVRVWPTPAFQRGTAKRYRPISFAESGSSRLLGNLNPVAASTLRRPIETERHRFQLQNPDRRRAGHVGARRGSSSEAELLDQGAVPIDVFALEIIQQATALTHDLEKTASRMMILRVRPEMLLESRDPLRQERDLYLGRAGIGVAPLVGSNDFRLLRCRDQVF